MEELKKALEAGRYNVKEIDEPPKCRAPRCDYHPSKYGEDIYHKDGLCNLHFNQFNHWMWLKFGIDKKLYDKYFNFDFSDPQVLVLFDEFLETLP